MFLKTTNIHVSHKTWNGKNQPEPTCNRPELKSNPPGANENSQETNQNLPATLQNSNKNLSKSRNPGGFLVGSCRVLIGSWRLLVGSGPLTFYKMRWMKLKYQSFCCNFIFRNPPGTHKEPIKTHQKLTNN